MAENTNKATLIQLKDADGNLLSPIVGMDSVLDENGLTVIEVINDRTYDKETIDEKIGNVDLTDYYTKDEVTGITDTKADKSTTYTKTETNTLLNDKANAEDTYTKNEVDAKVASLIDSAPGALDTLNELAAALGDDPNFATTVTNQLATKANAVDVYNKTEIDTKVNGLQSDVDSKANQSTTYNKDEVNDLIDAIPAPDMSNYYTKTEVTNITDTKAALDYAYSKNETNTLLNDKANQSTTYTKTEVDDLIDAIPETDLSNYYDKPEVNELLIDVVEHEVVISDAPIYSNDIYVTESMLDEKLSDFDGGSVDLSNIYTKTQSDAKYVAKDDIVVSQANGRMKIVAIGSKYNTVLPITETGIYAIEIIKGDGTRHTSVLTISHLNTNATCDVRLYSNIYVQVRYKSGQKGIQLDAPIDGGSYLAATKIIDMPEWVV